MLFRSKGRSEGEENRMSLSKTKKEEMKFYTGGCGRVRYNPKCLSCAHDCKQSFRAELVTCPKYERKVK